MNNPLKKKSLLERAKMIDVQEQRRKHAKNEACLDEYLDAIVAWLNRDVKSKQLSLVINEESKYARTSMYNWILSVLMQGIDEGKIKVERYEVGTISRKVLVKKQ